MAIDDQIVNVNEYDLAATAGEFVEAITALARRTETEGDPGVLRYQFFVNRETETAIATIVYRDAAAWPRVDGRARSPAWKLLARRCLA